MAVPPILLFDATEVRPLTGDALREALVADVELAVSRLWVSAFLIGLEANDARMSVRFLLDAFVRAARRHVDVRIIVDDFRVGPEGFRSNAVAAGYLTQRGVAVRVYTGPKGRASHSKFLIMDEDAVIVGSGNLTPGGLDNNHELALRVRSTDLARDLARRFDSGWAESTPWTESP